MSLLGNLKDLNKAAQNIASVSLVKNREQFNEHLLKKIDYDMLPVLIRSLSFERNHADLILSRIHSLVNERLYVNSTNIDTLMDAFDFYIFYMDGLRDTMTETQRTAMEGFFALDSKYIRDIIWFEERRFAVNLLGEEYKKIWEDRMKELWAELLIKDSNGEETGLDLWKEQPWRIPRFLIEEIS